MPQPTQKIGRTTPDLILYFLSSWRRLLATIVASIFVLGLAVLLLWVLAEKYAKPGAEINVLWGAIKYQKNGGENISTVVLNAEKSRQLLWYVESDLKPTSGGYGAGTTNLNSPTPILDGTLSLWGWDNDIFVGGLNVHRTLVAARSNQANTIEPRRVLTTSSGKAVYPHIALTKCGNGCVVELQYRSHVLRITLEREEINDGKKERTTAYAIIEKIGSPTLELQPFASLKEF